MITSDRERQAPLSVEETEPSHLARYRFATKFIEESQIILDAPCGSGYGTAVLSSKARQVYGVDISADAIDHAKEFFKKENNSFVVSNIENMASTFPDSHSFDLIISFEGIEHLYNPEMFLKESARLLKPKGKLIISTPRRPHGSPYHTTEYNLEEYKMLLSKHFIIEKMYGQLFVDIFDMNERNEDPDTHLHFNFIAICSPK